MKAIKLTVLTLGALTISPNLWAIPAGSYAKTCNQITEKKGLFGARSLEAKCAYWVGNKPAVKMYQKSTLHGIQDCKKDIANCNGKLRCGSCD